MKSGKNPVLFEDNFLESYASAIIKDFKVAIIELIANSWDAGATKVQIFWPMSDGDAFSITDNGHGMTTDEFDIRFRYLSYNRAKHQGIYAEVPNKNKIIGNRPVFGKNGKGRFAAFMFGNEYFVKTWKKGLKNEFRVIKDNPVGFYPIGKSEPKSEHGTEIYIPHSVKPTFTEDEIRREIGMRFMSDPNFEVVVNNKKVTFEDIPESSVTNIEFLVDGNIGAIKVIDVNHSDRTTQLHGVAWHVQERLVGECSWKGYDYLIDGRRVVAKRFIFIIKANFLKDVVLPDWTGFNTYTDIFEKTNTEVQNQIKAFINKVSEEQREETLQEIKQNNNGILKKISYISRLKWEVFISTVQQDCPNISEVELDRLGALLANLEESSSQYNLIRQLANLTPEQLDKLDEILSKWSVDMATIVLDELEFRLKLLEQLQSKFLNGKTDEVQELQPLFHRGLWIFGPEYETIEFTSNQGMTSVIQNLFGEKNMNGSLQRPDFAIIPNASVGLYSYPKYDKDGSELGIDKLTIVELKKPTVPIGSEQKGQAWKYVVELMEKGLIDNNTRVDCFIVGSFLAKYESSERTENNGNVRIIPMDYDTVIKRAKSRLLKLHEKVKNSPFLQTVRLKEIMLERSQTEIFA